MKLLEQKIIIRETHLDFFGHVNNAAYLTIFEDARWDLLASRGFDLAHMTKTKTGPVILDCHIKFLKELRGREEITVTVEKMVNEKPHSKVSQLRQQMLNQNGEVACEAIFTYGLFDLAKRRLIEATPDWRRVMEI